MGEERLRWKRRGFRIVCGLIMFLWATSLCAADEEAEDLFSETKLMFIGEDLYTVSIASRRDEPLKRAPAAVTVIAGDRLRGYRTLAEVLRSVPGFFIDRTEVKDRAYLRGVPDSFLVMMDGVPFSNDTSTGDYPRGLELSLSYIEKIEIIRGPGSALWGADAFSGVVNLVTKKGRDVKGLIASVEGGTFNTKRAHVLGGHEARGVDFLFFASASESDDFEHNVPGGDRLRDHFAEFYGKIQIRDSLEISGRYSRYRDFYSNPFNLRDGDSSEYKPFSFVQTTYTKSWDESRLLLKAYAEEFDNFEKVEIARLRSKNWQYGAEGQYDFSLWSDHLLTAGLAFRYNDGRRTEVRPLIPLDIGELDVFPSFDFHRVSVFVQDKYKISDALEMTLGVRYDDHSEYRRTWSPRAGISWLVSENLGVKLLYGRAFRTPRLNALLFASDLDTERIESYELELNYTVGDTLELRANFFYNIVKDLIQGVRITGDVINSGREYIKGVELSFTYSPLDNLSLYGNYYNLFDNRTRGVRGRALANLGELGLKGSLETVTEGLQNIAPDYVFNLGATYRFLRRCTANLRLNYASQRKLGDYYTEKGTLSPYLVTDFDLLIGDLSKDRWEVALRVRNIFKEGYETRGDFPAGVLDGMERGVFVTASYKF